MPFIDRTDGKITAVYANPQTDNQDYLEENDPEVIAFFKNLEGAIAPPPAPQIQFNWASFRTQFEESPAWERIGNTNPVRASRLESTLWQFGENPMLLSDIQRQWNAVVVPANPTEAEIAEARSLLAELIGVIEQTVGVKVAIADNGELKVG